jgi:signal transduction histidine kinase/CheY-like chemotaxis protein
MSKKIRVRGSRGFLWEFSGGGLAKSAVLDNNDIIRNIFYTGKRRRTDMTPAGTGKRIFAAALCLLLLCALLAAPAAALTGHARRTVRAGVSDADTPGTNGGENRTVAFQKDYLQALAEYANWDLVYVEAPWSECLEMARTGEIDVLVDVSRTQERLAYYDFSSESMGTEMCYLFGRDDTALHYDDFAAFDGMTVGYENGSSIVDSFRQYAEQMGFRFTAKPYISGAAMFAALDAGEVDTVVQNNFYDTPAGHIILAKCSPSPVYIVTSKAVPALKTELDAAMAQLFSFNPSFNADLFEYHFGNAVSQAVGYTQEEMDYLAGKPVVDVYYETNWAPFEYDKKGEAAGITPDILSEISADTGIRFRYVLSSSTQDIYTGISGVKADTVMAVSYDYLWADSHDLFVTQPYVSGAVLRVSQDGGQTPRSVAIVRGGYLASRIRQVYPELRRVEYATFGECMDAVARGKADCTYLNYFQANYYRTMSAYGDFSYQPDEHITQGISLGVTKESNPLLFGILSKSLQHITPGKVQGILSENAVTTETYSVRMMLQRYPVQMALLIGLFGTLTGLILVFLVTSDARRRKNLQLAASIRAADAANRAKSEFLSRMSHDMRTPLNGILGMTYLTEKMELPPAAQENLRKIDVSSHFLLSLINNLLDMSKAESGKIELHPEPYSPKEFGVYIDAVIRPICQSKNQTLRVEILGQDDCVPVIDKLRINQIVFNLLSNAVKYTPEGGEIVYRSEGERLPDGRLALHIRVSDNGVGMSEAFQKVLFTPFTQEARNENSDQRGSGLGLAITRQLVERMGGTISAVSRPGEGSVFSVELSVDCACRGDEAAPAGPPKPPQQTALAGRRVLLCEDHPLNQEIAKALLSEWGIETEVAEDGQRGVSAFARAPIGYFDAILMDIRMPVLDGYQAARTIRALNRADAGTVPILAMSADVLKDDVQKCLDAGMNGHVAKPVEPAALRKALEEAIEKRV